jgi:hypothetical protein
LEERRARAAVPRREVMGTRTRSSITGRCPAVAKRMLITRPQELAVRGFAAGWANGCAPDEPDVHVFASARRTVGVSEPSAGAAADDAGRSGGGVVARSLADGSAQPQRDADPAPGEPGKQSLSARPFLSRSEPFPGDSLRRSTNPWPPPPGSHAVGRTDTEGASAGDIVRRGRRTGVIYPVPFLGWTAPASGTRSLSCAGKTGSEAQFTTTEGRAAACACCVAQLPRRASRSHPTALSKRLSRAI